MQHQLILFCFFSLGGIWYLISRCSRVNQELSLLNSVTFISLFLYVGAWFEQLVIANIFLKALGVMGVLILIFDMKRGKVLPPSTGILFFLMSILYLYWLCQAPSYAVFPIVDDYTHWGRMSQVIAENHRLPLPVDELGVTGYPPILALFQYFFLSHTGFYMNLALFTQGVFVLACSALLFFPLANLKIHGTWITALIAMAIYSLIWIFQHGFHTLWADLPLGIAFGISIYVYFSRSLVVIKSWFVTLVGLLSVIVLIKQIGIVFMFATLILMILDLLMNKNYQGKYKNISLIFLTLLIVPCVFHLSWDMYLISHNISQSTTPAEVHELFLNLWSPNATERQVLTRERFIEHIFFSHHTGTYWFLVLLLNLSLIFKITRSRDSALIKSSPAIWILVPGFFGYLFLLLFLYLTKFTEWEGVRLASIDRYANTYLLGAVLASLGLMVNQTLTIDCKGNPRKWPLVVVVFLCMIPNVGRILIDTHQAIVRSAPKSTAFQIEALAKKVQILTPSNASIYLLWDGGTTDELAIFRFFNNSRIINHTCSSLRPIHITRNDNDPWSCAMTSHQFLDRLSNFDYLVVAQVNPETSDYFTSTLQINDVKSGAIYSLTSNNGILRAVLIH